MASSELERQFASKNLSFQRANKIANQLLADEGRNWKRKNLRLSTLFWAERCLDSRPQRALGAFFVGEKGEVFEASVNTNDEPMSLGELKGSPLAEPVAIETVNEAAVKRSLRRFDEFAAGRALAQIHLVSGYVPECFPQSGAALWVSLSMTASDMRIVAANASTGAVIFTTVLPALAFGGPNLIFAMGWFKKLQLALIIAGFAIAIVILAMGGNPGSFMLILMVIRIAIFMISMILELPTLPAPRKAKLNALARKLNAAKKAIEMSQNTGTKGPTAQQIKDVNDAIKDLGGEIDSMKANGEIDGDTANGLKDDLKKAQDGMEKIGK